MSSPLAVVVMLPSAPITFSFPLFRLTLPVPELPDVFKTGSKSTSATAAFSCCKLTASVLSVPAATPVIFLPPALMPPVVTEGPPLMVRPLLFSVVGFVPVPKATLPSVPKFNELDRFTLISCPSAAVVMLLLPPITLNVWFASLTLPDPEVPFMVKAESPTASARALNCATFTASVGAVPAATPVICLVTALPFPTAIAACVDFQALGFALVFPAPSGLKPDMPLSVPALDSAPNATVPACETVAPTPMAAEPSALVSVLPPKAAKELSANAFESLPKATLAVPPYAFPVPSVIPA